MNGKKRAVNANLMTLAKNEGFGARNAAKARPRSIARPARRHVKPWGFRARESCGHCTRKRPNMYNFLVAVSRERARARGFQALGGAFAGVHRGVRPAIRPS